MPKLRSVKAVEEVGVPAQMGGHSSIMDTMEMATFTAGSGEMEEVWVTEPAARVDIIKVMGVHTRVKGTHQTLHNPRTEIGSIAVIRTTAMEVGQDKQWLKGKQMGVYDRKKRGDTTEKGGVHSGRVLKIRNIVKRKS